MSTRTHGIIQRDLVPNTIMYVLSRQGETINVLENERSQKYLGDQSQIKYKNKQVWHKREYLIISVAKILKIHPSMWGPTRISSDFYNVIDQEIAKLRKKNIIIDWNSSKRLGIFRLSKDPGSIIYPKMSVTEKTNQIKAQKDTDTVEENLKQTLLSILTGRNKDNTYKFTLAQILLDYCKETTKTRQTYEISYKYLSDRFLKYYWHQEYKFKMKQDFRIKGKPKVIQALHEVFGDNPPADFKLLDPDDINRAQDKILKTVFGHARNKTSLVVPKFQNVLKGKHVEEIGIFYDYDDNEKKIYLKSEAFEFLRKNNAILSKVVLAEWARYLERVNQGLPRLVAKIDHNNTVRGSLVPYQKIYSEYIDHCFYCASKLERNYTHVDHFIPWSYIFDDNAWNLVLACQECNCKKSNSLAEEEFLDALIARNTKYYSIIKKLKISLQQLQPIDWKPEIKNHYTTCQEYGFRVIPLP